MRNVKLINQGWLFREGNEVVDILYDFSDYQPVTLPHNAVDIPLNYFDETCLHRDFTYQYLLKCDSDYLKRHTTIHFEGALSNAQVFVNGKLAGAHSDGYTPFEVLISPWLKAGENLITLTLSGVENPGIPPFGGMIDYLCFPGIYRDVRLIQYDSIRISNIKIETHNILSQPQVTVDVYLQQFTAVTDNARLIIQLSDPGGRQIAKASQKLEAFSTPINIKLDLNDPVLLWDIDNPALYTITVALEADQASDLMETRFGFRQAEFRLDGFYLNGKRLQLTGVNRHQSYPYVGYAMGRRAQEFDAELIKNQLGFNLARTSHYPQSPDFLNRCDELGLLVFEEIPGWQHVGDQQWQEKSLQNVRAMIERDWNHPCVILWGVRINESEDNRPFYQKTNTLARQLDKTRQTGGVRYIQNSEFLEDVYTMNDFILGDGDQALRSPQNVTGLAKPVPYLITEYAGHMFPTKRTDCENWQMEHVTRHLKVLNASRADPNISGAVTWCLFDYNTHHNFGSGDKVCYHGVTDAFRLPKFAASVYASQQPVSQNVILTPVTYWTRGERPAAKSLPLIILTNCDYVALQLPSGTKKNFYPDRVKFSHLPHPPIIIDELNIGEIMTGEWGCKWTDLYLYGYVGENKVKEVKLAASPVPGRLDIDFQCRYLHPQGDETRVALRALDQNNQLLPYFRDIISLSCSEHLRVIGSEMLIIDGGVAAFWLRSVQPGTGEIIINSRVFGEQKFTLDINRPVENKLPSVGRFYG